MVTKVDKNGDVDLRGNDDDDDDDDAPPKKVALFSTNGAKCRWRWGRGADRLAADKARTAELAALRCILLLFFVL